MLTGKYKSKQYNSENATRKIHPKTKTEKTTHQIVKYTRTDANRNTPNGKDSSNQYTSANTNTKTCRTYKSTKVIGKIQVGECKSKDVGKYPSENTSRKTTIQNMQIGKYKSQKRKKNVSGDTHRENTHQTNTPRKILIGRIQLGNLQFGNTIRKTQFVKIQIIKYK